MVIVDTQSSRQMYVHRRKLRHITLDGNDTTRILALEAVNSAAVNGGSVGAAVGSLATETTEVALAA